MPVRYNIILADGALPVLQFDDTIQATTVRVSDHALCYRNPSTAYVMSGNGQVFQVPEAGALFEGSTARQVTVPLFQILNNPEVHVTRVEAEPDLRVKMAVDGVNGISDMLEELAEAADLEFEREFGTPPVTVLVLVRTGPSLIEMDDLGSTVGFSIFMDVGVVALSVLPEAWAEEWVPSRRLLPKLPRPLQNTVAAVQDAVRASMKAGGTLEAPPVEPPSVKFTDPVAWLKEADKRKAEGHVLVSWDDPLGRRVGFRDETTDEWLTIQLPYLRYYGEYVRDEDKEWFLARMAHMRSTGGRVTYFSSPPAGDSE